MSLISNIGTYGGTGSEAGSLIVPGVGTIVGGAVGTIIGVLTSLVGGTSQKDVANNNFIDNLVTSTQRLGFSGFTHEDVVHLMPGGWGTNYAMATSSFQRTLNYANTVPANTDLAAHWNQPGQGFGGGYIAAHEITYNPPVSNVNSSAGNTGSNNVGNINNTGTSTGIPGSYNASVLPAGKSNILMYVVFAIIALGIVYGLMKAAND